MGEKSRENVKETSIKKDKGKSQEREATYEGPSMLDGTWTRYDQRMMDSNPDLSFVKPATATAGSEGRQPGKHVSFELLLDEGSMKRARIPLRVVVNANDTTESIITTVKNFYGLYNTSGVTFEDAEANTLIASYDNLSANMTVYVRCVGASLPQPSSGPDAEHETSYITPANATGQALDIEVRSISGDWVRKDAYIPDGRSTDNYMPDGIAISLGYSNESVITLDWRPVGTDLYRESTFQVRKHSGKGLIILGGPAEHLLAVGSILEEKGE